MSQPELEADAESPSQTDREPEAADSGKTEPEKRKLQLDVQITDVGPCKKHLKVEIAAGEVERQFDESLGKFRKEAAVPGFRPGRAPRLLVQKRYKKEVSGQVKSTLLMSCMEQLDEDYKLNPITQPQLDLEAIEIPDEGPLKFELDIEVQPEFQVPEYKSLKLERPVREVTEPDIDKQQKTFLERYARLVPKTTGGAEMDDYVTADLTFHKGGVRLNQAKEVQFRLLTELRFQDGRIPQLDKALLGAKPGESRESEAKIGTSSPDPAIRGQTIQVEFLIHELKSLRLPELDAAFLDKIGFDSVADLRQALSEVLERRFAFQQRQAIRRQIVDKLLAEVQFDLPKDLIARQERSTLRRLVEEMRQAGLSDRDIRAREAELRANAHDQTLRSIKEFFLLSKIAEAEELKVEDEDVEQEIELMAARSDETPRRVRARIDKEGLADGLVSQILERKAIDRVMESAEFKVVPLVEDRPVETLEETTAAIETEPPQEESESSETESETESATAGEPGP